VKQLLSRINDKTALIGIVGLGYVGLPLALRFIEAGFHVLGFDVDQKKVDFINDGKTYIKHIDGDAIATAAKSGLLSATTDMSRSKEADALIMCVPTPLTKQRQPDLSYVMETLEALVPYLRKGQMVSLESTTYPGTTDEELYPCIAETGLTVGEDVFLVYSPERVDPGNEEFPVGKIPKVCSGYTDNCLKVGVAFYEKIVDQVVQVSNTRAAEMTKLLENIHRAVNIGLVNELKIVADKMDIDIYEVIRAAATKPFGFVPYFPGPGLGGHCLPIDPFYLTWKAREFGVNTRFIELAGEVNEQMPDWVVYKTMTALNERGKTLQGAKILVLGISYKSNIDDIRESPAVHIMEKLRNYGAVLSYSDPHFPSFPAMREHHFEMDSLEITPETLAAHDCVMIITAHDLFDYDLIKKKASLVIDTRGVYLEPLAHVVRA
jgi:UDP-N-acetyl-D-glucosamine dehydrogenase